MSDALMYLALGKIVALHQRKMDMRYQLKKLIAKAVTETNDARRDLAAFGMFEDAGQSYESAHSRALGYEQGVMEWRHQLVRIEKYQKKSMHKFKEEFPDSVPLLLQTIEEATRETHAYLNGKS